MTQLGRLATAIMMSFTSTMLLGATLAWGTQKAAGSLSSDFLDWVLWPLLAATFFVWSFVLEYLDDGNSPRSARAGLTNTAVAALAIVIIYAAWTRALPFHFHLPHG
jgi:hypothetical protein